MNTRRERRTLDFFAGAVVHGCLLLFLAPLIGRAAWSGVVCVAGLACAFRDRWTPVVGRRATRGAAVAYGVVVAAAALWSWTELCFYSPWSWFLIGLFGLASFAMLRDGLEPIAGVWIVAGLAFAGLAAAEARLAATWPTMLLLAIGLTAPLLSIFSGRVDAIGRGFMALFSFAAATAGANGVFVHGVVFPEASSLASPGLNPLLIWSSRSQVWKTQLGLECRYAQLDPFDRLLIGSDNGIFLFDSAKIEQLAVGPAGENVAVDAGQHRAFVATRDGVLHRLDGPELTIGRQAGLAGPGRLVRTAPEGVYALAGRRHLGLYDPETLQSRRQWDDEPLDDLAPDGKGGYFAATTLGQLRHATPGGAGLRSVALGFWRGRHALALDPAGGRLFVASSHSLQLRVYASDDLRPLTDVAIGWGGQSLVWSGKRATLFVGRRYAGEVLALAGDDLHVAGRIALGPRLMSVALTANEQLLYVATAAGVFSLNIDDAFPTPQ